MRILTDVDGVLADLVGALALGEGLVTSYHFADCLTEDKAYAAHIAMSTPGFCADIPWYPGAQAFLNRLKMLGDVIAVTAPYKDGRTWQYERARWLAPYIERQIHTAHKELIWGDVLIEDNLEFAERWQKAHPSGIAILMDRPWNQGESGRAIRVTSYVDALGAVRAVSRIPSVPPSHTDFGAVRE